MRFALFSALFVALALSLSSLLLEQAAAYNKHHGHDHGHVKIKVWRGPSHGYKKHKYAPFGYHFAIEEKGHH